MINIIAFILIISILLIALYTEFKYKIDTSIFNSKSVYIMHNAGDILYDKKLMYIHNIKKIFNYYEIHCFIDGQYCIVYSKGKILWYGEYYTEPRDFVDKCSKKYFLENYKRIPLKIL